VIYSLFSEQAWKPPVSVIAGEAWQSPSFVIANEVWQSHTKKFKLKI